MYVFFIVIQYLGIGVLTLEILYLLNQKTSKLQLLMLMVSVSTLINFIGYLFEMRAGTKELALQAVKFLYLGKPLIILGMFLFVVRYYKVKCPSWLTYVLFLIHVGITLCVLECERTPLYYSSIDYVQDGYFPHLVLGKGIVYILYSGLIVCYLVLIVVFSVIHYRRTNDRRERIRIKCLCGAPLVSALGLLIYFSGVTKGYDSTLPAYVVATTLLFISMLRYRLLDTMTLAREMVMDNFADGLAVLDTDEKLLYSNPQLQEIYPALQTDGYEGVIDDLDELCKKKENAFVNDRVYHVTRSEIIHDGEQYGRMYVARDITEQYSYTAELQRQTEIAEQANRAKSDFLAKMSHEIRTPINSVMGMNEMILRESGEDVIRTYARNVKASANALLGIINEILDLAKVESGKLEIHPAEYELGELLEGVLQMIYVRTLDAGLELDVQVQPDLPGRLFGDDVRIRQILTNLLTNAVKYTEEGTVTLRVTGREQGENAILHFEVEDTGIGIKEKDMPKLYATFERIEEDRNRGIEGTGLGMSIVIELLHRMDSDLYVESVYGEGSRFWFDLKQKVADREPIGDFQGQSRWVEQDQKYHASFVAPEAKILLVDDNDINRSVFCNLLKQTGVRIVDVESGPKCLEALRREAFDVVFLDHMMPGMDGIETLRRMREMDDNLSPDAAVIVLTANAIAGARENYLAEGFDDFLSKPVVPEDLERLLRQYLPGASIQEPPAGEPAAGTSIQAPPAGEEAPPLPELDEFDLEYARFHLPDDGIIRQTMLLFYHSADKNAEELERLAPPPDGVWADPMLQRYRICVHSLKSTAASIGALLLSKLARIVEAAAIEKDVEKILLLHPILIEELKKHRDRLQVLESESGEKAEADMEQIAPLLKELAAVLEDRDYDRADELMEELAAYQYSDGMREQMEKLRGYVLDLEAESAMEIVGQLLRISA